MTKDSGSITLNVPDSVEIVGANFTCSSCTDEISQPKLRTFNGTDYDGSKFINSTQYTFAEADIPGNEDGVFVVVRLKGNIDKIRPRGYFRFYVDGVDNVNNWNINLSAPSYGCDDICIQDDVGFNVINDNVDGILRFHEKAFENYQDKENRFRIVKTYELSKKYVQFVLGIISVLFLIPGLMKFFKSKPKDNSKGMYG
ncbi:hypothetical protein HY988_01550 [Candidatus Micrarchaeota archaeon]|nr:hypothetical protein [Candidatus Micrarchaeota archaeon]